MLSCFNTAFLAMLCILCTPSNSHNVTFSAISILNSGTTGKSIVGAQWLAMQEINKNPDLLTGIHLQLNTYDSKGDTSDALLHALKIINIKRKQTAPKNHTHFPILLGCPWSSLSAMISPALGAFQMGQISSGSTSISLADTSKYPFFYRTIPSDILQAKGIILLCKEFNWTEIAIVYVNDPYGLYLSIGIMDLAFEEGITATSVAFTTNEQSTIENAAYQVSQLNTFIIIFIVHDTDLSDAFKAFADEGLTGFPYYYIGVDAWLDSGSITGANASMFAQGSIGTIPWQTLAMPLDAYDDGIQPVIEEAMAIYDDMLNLWSDYWQNGYYELNVETPSTTSIYGYDAMFSLAYALQQYLEEGYDINEMNISVLNAIMINEVEFIGASGNVVYDDNGDRAQGLYAFGNALEDGAIEYFGYFYVDGEELRVSVDYDKIVWPTYFTERGMKPQSGVVTTIDIMTIAPNILIPIYILCILSIIVVTAYAILTWKYHTNQVLRAASWKINLVMCVGCIFGYTAMLLYGVDEQSVSPGSTFDFLCNCRVWLWIMSYTLLFMPLFVKTYRLAQIFNEILDEKHIEDRHLYYMILACVVVDLLLLTTYTAIEPLERMHISGYYQQKNQLQRIHYKYGSCETNNGVQYIFYGLITLWKCIESLFGIYCALSVSRVGRKELSQFDETSQQLLAIAFLIMAVCIAIPVGFLGGDTNPTWFYATVGFLTISVANVTTALNMLPRLWAVITGRTSSYNQSPQEKVERLIMRQLKRIGIDEAWWQKNVTLQNAAEMKSSRSDLNGLNVPTGTSTMRSVGNISNGTCRTSTLQSPLAVEYDEDEEVRTASPLVSTITERYDNVETLQPSPDIGAVSHLANHLEMQNVTKSD